MREVKGGSISVLLPSLREPIVSADLHVIHPYFYPKKIKNVIHPYNVNVDKGTHVTKGINGSVSS